MPHPFRLLRKRRYFFYFSGLLVSLSGNWLQQVAQGWLVYRLTGSGAWLGAISFLNQVPAFFLSPVAGAVADRTDRRRVLLLVQVAGAVQSLILALLCYRGTIQVWQVGALAVFLGVITGFEMTTRHAFAVDLVGREDLPNAIALNSFLINVSRITGPAIAGLLIASLGETGCFFLNALSFLPVIATLAWLPKSVSSRQPSTDPRRRPLAQILEGMRYAASHAVVKRLLLYASLVSFFGAPLTVLLPPLARDVLHGDAHTLSLLTSSLGLGALIGAISVPAWVADPARRDRFILLRAALLGLFLLGIGLSPALPATLLALGLAGYFMMGVFPAINSAIQLAIDDRYRGRVLALYTMTFLGTAPLASLLEGFLSDAFGVRAVLAASGVVCAGVAGALIWRRNSGPVS